jgi:hypothetical protein
MKTKLDPAYQAIANQFREEARCWPWRRLLIDHRIRELGDIEHGTDKALIPHASVDEVRTTVLHLRELLEKANKMLRWDEYDYTENICEQGERALIKLRNIAGGFGVI